MDTMEKEFQKMLAAEGEDVSDVRYREIHDAFLAEVLPQMAKLLRRAATAQLRKERKDVLGFQKRNFHRWKPAFDLIEIIWEISQDLGGTFNNKFRPEAAKAKDCTFEALTNLHARALLVAKESICLMKNGFADGALARWRTLHELNVIAVFLANRSQKTAFLYLASFDFQALKAARQLQVFSARAKIAPFSTTELDAMEARCASLRASLGTDLSKDYSWASSDLSGRVTFGRIEEAVGMDHWRPRFRWSSQHTHGGHRPALGSLGTAEAKIPVLLVGESNSGMVDPLQMVAISLVHVTATLLLSKPNLDRIVFAKVLSGLSDELGPLALRLEAVTAATAAGTPRPAPAAG